MRSPTHDYRQALGVVSAFCYFVVSISTHYDKSFILPLLCHNKFDIIWPMDTLEVTSKPLVILHGEIKTPPFSAAARMEAGINLRKLQRGMTLSMPISRPMPTIGARCAELRIVDVNTTWRIIYRVDADAVLIAEVFAKKTQATPKTVIKVCKQRLRDYDAITKGV